MKLSPITFIIWGICACIVGLTFGYVNWAPNMKEASLRHDNQVAAETEAGKQGRAVKRVKDAQALVEAEAARWAALAATKSPGTDVARGGIDISVNGAKLIVTSQQFRDSVQAAVNKQLLVGGVKLVTEGPSITAPGESPSTILADYYNYPAIPFPVVIFDLGPVTVQGTYEQICANVRAWKNMPNYLAVADGLRIEGTSPNMTGTYDVSIVGYVHGSKLFSKLPEVPGAAGAATGGAGGPGGPGRAGGGGQGAPMNANKQAFMRNGGTPSANAGK
jgi:hypothetical protein